MVTPMIARLLLLSLLVLSPAAAAQTVTVDIARDDVADFGGAQTVADLPGPDGHVSLREAVLAANNTAGPQTIRFAIPTSEWSPFFSEGALIVLENMVYLDGDDTTFDFSSQAELTGDNPGGGEVGLHYVGPPAGIPSLYIAADRCLVRGLDVTFGNNFSNGIWITGSDNVVVGCNTGGMIIRGDSGGGDRNVIGGVGPGDSNVFSDGVDILSGASDNVLIGNTFNWGLRISGDSLYGTCDRNRIGGADPRERNVLSGKGYYGEEGFPLGTQLQILRANGTVVQGNYVGTTADGLADYPGRSGTGGIVVDTGANDTLVRDNVVASIDQEGQNHYFGQRFGTGIAVVASARRTTLTGNRVGVGADGVTPLGNVEGVLVQSNPNGVTGDVFLGGTGPGEANVIAQNRTNGVRIGGSAFGVRVRGNSIHDNGALGIDLVGFLGSGPTPNDPLDADTDGGNRLQNFPRVLHALNAGPSTMVAGDLDSEPLQSYDVDVYASPTRDPSGFGEGARFLGTTRVTTGPDGRATFAANLPGIAPAGWSVSATATHVARGETSEFSAARMLNRVRPAFAIALDRGIGMPHVAGR